MKRSLILSSLVAIALLGYGAFLSVPAEAGCGGSSGCGMSHATQQQPTAPAAEAGQYSCPMHPEVVSDKPGTCSKCGMDLEEVQSTAGNQPEMLDHVAEQCQQMVDDFTELKAHFDMMMKLTDVENLGPAMIEHEKMMAQFSADLTAHHKECRQMVSEMNEERSSGSGHSNHGH